MFRLLFLAFLLSTSTLATPHFFRRSPSSPPSYSDDTLQPILRQTTKTQILTRERVAHTRAQIDQAHKRWLGPGLSAGGGAAHYPPSRAVGGERALKARASVAARQVGRETCIDPAGGGGWAKYVGWELEFDDIPGGARYVDSDIACAQACTVFGAACAGSQYIPSAPDDEYNCFLKGTSISPRYFTDQSEEAQEEGTIMRLIGGCDTWSSIVPENMDAACCNT